MHGVIDSRAGKSARSLLQNIPLFAGLPEAQLDHIAKMAVLRQVPRHKMIVFVGAKTDSLFVIVSGSAKVLNRDAEGREVILSMLEAGECFGEMGLIDDSPRSAAVADDVFRVSRGGRRGTRLSGENTVSANRRVCAGVLVRVVYLHRLEHGHARV